MIVVREVFIAKPGMASKLAKMFKEMADRGDMGQGAKVLTDMTGTFNKVVIETEYQDVSAYDKDMQEYMNQPTKPDAPKSPHIDMYTEGKREIFRIW